MRLRTASRPRKEALLFSALWLGLGVLGAHAAYAADAPPQPKPGKIASSLEQLRVHEVADQLIRYLGKAVEWVDLADTRVPVQSLAPKIRAVVLAHPEVRLAREQRETATLATREAFAGFLPQVSANVESGLRRNERVSTPWSSIPAYQDNSKALAVSARQLIYDFGAVGSRVDSRTALKAAADARSEVKSSELTLRALTAWLEVFRGQEILAVSRMNVLSRQQILSFIEEREQLGGSALGDVFRARARLADARATAVVAQNRLTVSEAVYREVFDEAPSAQLALPEAAPVAIERFANLSGWLSRNANLAEARAQTEAARHEAKSAAAALLPTIYLDITARRRDIGGQGVPGSDWTAGFSLKQNLYSGGAELARKQQAEQRATESQLGEDNLRRQVERAFSQSIADVKNSTEAVAARKEAVQVAAVALEAVREQFAFRRGTLLDLLRSQEELYTAGRDLIDSIVDHALVRYRLLNLAMELTPMFDIPAGSHATRN
jgi:adhesin transport system outer membrane protein